MATGQQPRIMRKAARRKWLVLAAAIVLIAGLAWYGWRRDRFPSPQVELLDGADPALVKAVAEARRQIDLDPRSAEAWGYLGQLLLANMLDRLAIVCLAHAEQLDPADGRWPYFLGFAYLLAEPEKAIPCFEHAVACLQGQEMKEWFARLRLAETLLAWGRFSQAEVEYRRLLAVAPDEPLVHWGLGCVAMAKGDWPAARDHLEVAKKSPWTEKKANSQLAQVYQHLQQPELAKTYQERARRLRQDAERDDPFLRDQEELIVTCDARLLQADKLRQRGRWDAAEALLRRLIDDNPQDYRPYVKLGEVLDYRGNYAAAQEELEKALPLAADQVKVRFFLAVALFHQGEQLQKRAPKDAAEKFQSAAAQARQTIALQANHPLAHVYLGLSLKQLGQAQEALAALRQAVACGPEAVDPHLHLGKALAEMGQTAEARKHLENALRVASPTDPRPQQELDKLRTMKNR